MAFVCVCSTFTIVGWHHDIWFFLFYFNPLRNPKANPFLVFLIILMENIVHMKSFCMILISHLFIWCDWIFFSFFLFFNNHKIFLIITYILIIFFVLTRNLWICEKKTLCVCVCALRYEFISFLGISFGSIGKPYSVNILWIHREMRCYELKMNYSVRCSNSLSQYTHRVYINSNEWLRIARS
jgi:hypothetical protein